MSLDESAALATLEASREIFRSHIQAYGGRVVDMAGDSVLAVFETATGASQAAIAIQQNLNQPSGGQTADQRLAFRIGLNLGDVIEKGDGSVYGSGINVAARLQALSPPSGIVVSEAVHAAVSGKHADRFRDLGERELKNIPGLVRTYELHAELEDAKKVREFGQVDLSLPKRPSIAVLAMSNLSGDPDHDYFTDAISEDIITELSRFHELFVIARNSSFSYKGTSVDIRTIGTELGVRYVLQGSIRRSGARIRITAQLVDTITGAHIWAERYDRALEDVFAVQDEVTMNIVRAIAPQVVDSESERVLRKHPDSLQGYEIAVRAHANIVLAFIKGDPSLVERGMQDAHAALAIDPRSSLALFAFAMGEWQRVYLGIVRDPVASWHSGMNAANLLIEIDRTASQGYTAKGVLQVNEPLPTRDGEGIEIALSNLRHACELNPHSVTAILALCYGECMAGNAELAIASALQALRLSPRDPLRFNFYHQLSMASFDLGEYANSLSYARLGLADSPGFAMLHADMAKCYAARGEGEMARAAFEQARRLWPQWVNRALDGNVAHRNPDLLRKHTSFLRLAAGL